MYQYSSSLVNGLKMKRVWPVVVVMGTLLLVGACSSPKVSDIQYGSPPCAPKPGQRLLMNVDVEEGMDISFEWSVTGPGRLDGPTNQSSVIYVAPQDGGVATINVTVKDQGKIVATRGVTCDTLAPTPTPTPPTPTPTLPTATFTPAPTDTSTPSPSPTPECIDNLVNYSSGFVPISVQGKSTSTATLISGKLQVSFSNSRSGSGVAFLFAPPFDVKDFRFLELSGTSTHAFTFLVEYKVRGADGSLTIVKTSTNQSFPATGGMQTITVPLEYRDAVDEIVLDFPAQDESSLLIIECLRLR